MTILPFILFLFAAGFTFAPVGTAYLDKPVKALVWRNFSQLFILKKNGTLEVIDLLENKHMPFHFPPSEAMSLDASERYLALARGRTVHIYDLTTHKMIHQLEMDSAITHLRFQPKQAYLLIACTRFLKRWAFKQGFIDGIALKSRIQKWDLTSDGKVLALMDHDNNLIFWGLEKGWVFLGQHPFQHRLETLLFTNQGQRLITATRTQAQMDVWRWQDMHHLFSLGKTPGSQVFTLTWPPRLLQFLPGYTVALSPNGAVVALVQGKKIDILKIMPENARNIHFRSTSMSG